MRPALRHQDVGKDKPTRGEGESRHPAQRGTGRGKGVKGLRGNIPCATKTDAVAGTARRIAAVVAGHHAHSVWPVVPTTAAKDARIFNIYEIIINKRDEPACHRVVPRALPVKA